MQPPCDWFETNSRHQKRYSEGSKKIRGCRGLLGSVIYRCQKEVPVAKRSLYNIFKEWLMTSSLYAATQHFFAWINEVTLVSSGLKCLLYFMHFLLVNFKRSFVCLFSNFLDRILQMEVKWHLFSMHWYCLWQSHFERVKISLINHKMQIINKPIKLLKTGKSGQWWTITIPPVLSCLMINWICLVISGLSSLRKHSRISSIPCIRST